MINTKPGILILSVYYPPIPSIASYRMASIAKYLDKEKFRVFVLTLKLEENFQHTEIDTLKDIQIIRIPNKFFIKPAQFYKNTHPFIHYIKAFYNKIISLILPDFYFGWYLSAKKFLEETQFLKKNNIQVIIASFPPAAPHYLAIYLKNKNPHIKCIADIRDEMSNNIFLPLVYRIRLKQLEKQIIKYCDAISAISKPILEYFSYLAKINGINKIKFKEIRNGFDFDIKFSKPNNTKFTISYIGSFYGKRNPYFFFKALELLEDEILNNIKINLVGIKKPIKIPYRLQKIVTIIPFQPHEKAIEIMKQSDALLLIHPKGGKGIFTGKLFEYLGSLRPIIALVDKTDVAAQLIKEANAGYIADVENIEEIKNVIKQAYNDWLYNKPFTPKIDIIKKHHRKEQVKELEELILELLK